MTPDQFVEAALDWRHDISSAVLPDDILATPEELEALREWWDSFKRVQP